MHLVYLDESGNSGMNLKDPEQPIFVLCAMIVDELHLLRDTTGTMRLGQIVEKGFFVDSSKSLDLQLCDLFTLSLRKMAERKHGAAAKAIDDSGIAIAQSLLFRDHQNDQDVLEWLTSQHGRKKEAARG